MHIESWFCTRTRMLDCLVCLINSWISYLNQFFIWSSFNLDIPFLGFLSLLVLGKVMWETKPLLEYFVSKRRRATSHWLEFQQNTFNQVQVIKYKEDEKIPKVFCTARCSNSRNSITHSQYASGFRRGRTREEAVPVEGTQCPQPAANSEAFHKK